jgi:hypothetical protein
MLMYDRLITVVSAFLITTVDSSASDETEINFTIVVINLRMRKVFGNLINVESN